MAAEFTAPPDAEVLLLQAEASLAERDLATAFEAYAVAQASGADPGRCLAGTWMVSMLTGDFASAWETSDEIRRRGNSDPHRFWNGDDLRGKHVIVRSLHGFGDAVQMLRYAPQVRALAASVVYEVAPHLLPLARCFQGVEQVIAWTDPQPSWQAQIEMTEMPYIFRTEMVMLPLATGYLHLPGPAITEAMLAMGERKKPRIGLVWAAGEWNPGRSLTLEFFEPLLSDPRFEVWSLQGGSSALLRHPNLRCSTWITEGGLLSLAASIASLDLVVTVDTLAAHLAGALGKPVWVLLQHAADWRWMVGRNDSPWYPTMRLFRQPEPGNWQSVQQLVQRALAETEL